MVSGNVSIAIDYSTLAKDKPVGFGEASLFVARALLACFARTYGGSRRCNRAEERGLRRSPPTIVRFFVGGPSEADATTAIIPTAHAVGYEKGDVSDVITSSQIFTANKKTENPVSDLS